MDFIPEIIRFLKSDNVCMLGQAIWATGELRIAESVTRIKDCLKDDRETWIYENDTARLKKINEIASEALNKIQSHV